MGSNYGVESKKDFHSANVNVIFYDKGIISNLESHLNFLMIKKLVKGALFGTDDKDLFFRVIELIKNSASPAFILIISGSLAEEILPKLHDENFISDVLIFCYNLNKYLHLKTKFHKVRMIESNEFENIINFLKSKNYTLAQNKKGTKFLKNEPLITLSEYESFYYQYHHIIANIYSKERLKLTENDKSNFLYYVNNQKDNAKRILYNLKNDNDFYKNIINIYTKESPICYVLNKELRQLNPASYHYIKEYACSFLYSLYKYYNQNKMTGNIETKLYRALNLKLSDILLYKVCEGDIICYPGFTSACKNEITPDDFGGKEKDEEEKEEEEEKNEKKKKKEKKKSKAEIDDYIFAKKLQDETERLPSPLGQEIAYENENEFDDENEDNKPKNAFKKTNIVDCVDITFEINKEKNDYPSAINISALSDKKLEEERLFPAFSFFKIKKVILKDGTKENPHQIILEVIHKKYNLEERMVKGERVYLDSQTNLLMTRKFINE